MPPAEVWVAGSVMVALMFYALGAGADFGGGVWDLLAHGRSADRQRELIARAIGPIWEANHVWLILVVVLLFVCFPVAFAAIATALHIPLMLMLIGIVLRGSAFIFRAYDRHEDPVQHRWGRIFAIASTITPVMLGICVGAVAAGRVRVDSAGGRVLSGFVSSWLAPFPVALGLFTLALFAWLAAVYLTLETRDRELREQFRRRALWAAVAVGAMAWLCFAVSHRDAPLMGHGLSRRWWSLPFHVTTGSVALGAIAALWKRSFALARALAVLQVILILCGWAFAQFPYVLPPDLVLGESAAPPRVLRAVLTTLAVGALVLLPSLAYLFRVFKSGRPAREDSQRPVRG